MMDYMKDRRFVDAINEAKSFGIHVNDSRLDALLSELNLYIDDEDPEIPLWLLIRELGGEWTDYKLDNPTFDFYSNDVATIILEEYFRNYDAGVSHIFNELKRISKQKIEIAIIEETEYSEGGDEVTVKYMVADKVHRQKMMDDFGDSTIFNEDVEDILQNIKPIGDGKVIYFDDEFFTFVNTDNTELMEKLSKDFKVKRI